MRTTYLASAAAVWLGLAPSGPASALDDAPANPPPAASEVNDSNSPGGNVPGPGPFALGACAERVHLDMTANSIVKALTEQGFIREMNERQDAGSGRAGAQAGASVSQDSRALLVRRLLAAGGIMLSQEQVRELIATGRLYNFFLDAYFTLDEMLNFEAFSARVLSVMDEGATSGGTGGQGGAVTFEEFFGPRPGGSSLSGSERPGTGGTGTQGGAVTFEEFFGPRPGRSSLPDSERAGTGGTGTQGGSITFEEFFGPRPGRSSLPDTERAGTDGIGTSLLSNELREFLTTVGGFARDSLRQEIVEFFAFDTPLDNGVAFTEEERRLGRTFLLNINNVIDVENDRVVKAALLQLIQSEPLFANGGGDFNQRNSRYSAAYDYLFQQLRRCAD